MKMVPCQRARSAGHGPRPGLTLLEVFISLFIFLVAVTALWQLINVGTEQSLNVKQQAQASMLCQSKLAEVLTGAAPIEGSSGTFEEQPEWTYTIDSQPAEVENLYTVCVTVRCERQDGTQIKSSVTQMVLNPAARGSTLDGQATQATTTP